MESKASFLYYFGQMGLCLDRHLFPLFIQSFVIGCNENQIFLLEFLKLMLFFKLGTFRFEYLCAAMSEYLLLFFLYMLIRMFMTATITNCPCNLLLFIQINL